MREDRRWGHRQSLRGLGRIPIAIPKKIATRERAKPPLPTHFSVEYRDGNAASIHAGTAAMTMPKPISVPGSNRTSKKPFRGGTSALVFGAGDRKEGWCKGERGNPRVVLNCKCFKGTPPGITFLIFISYKSFYGQESWTNVIALFVRLLSESSFNSCSRKR